MDNVPIKYDYRFDHGPVKLVDTVRMLLPKTTSGIVLHLRLPAFVQASKYWGYGAIGRVEMFYGDQNVSMSSADLWSMTVSCGKTDTEYESLLALCNGFGQPNEAYVIIPVHKILRSDVNYDTIAITIHLHGTMAPTYMYYESVCSYIRTGIVCDAKTDTLAISSDSNSVARVQFTPEKTVSTFVFTVVDAGSYEPVQIRNVVVYGTNGVIPTSDSSINACSKLVDLSRTAIDRLDLLLVLPCENKNYVLVKTVR